MISRTARCACARVSLVGLGREWQVVHRTREYVTAISLIVAGFGVTVVPATLLGFGSDAVAYRPPRPLPEIRSELFIVPRPDASSPAVANILALADERTAGPCSSGFNR
jgi:DNA-binding transcriptional LysR family regulator